MKLKAYFEVKWKDIIATLSVPIILFIFFTYINMPGIAFLMYMIFAFFFMMIAIGVFDREFNIYRH